MAEVIIIFIVYLALAASFFVALAVSQRSRLGWIAAAEISTLQMVWSLIWTLRNDSIVWLVLTMIWLAARFVALRVVRLQDETVRIRSWNVAATVMVMDGRPPTPRACSVNVAPETHPDSKD